MEEDSAGLRRRNSIPSSVVIPTGDSKSLLRTSTNWANGQHHVSPPSPSASSSPVSGVEFELISLKPPSYISLKDILPFSPSLLSPTANAVISTTTTTTSASSTPSSLSSYEISIRNRLVKQAAWAYLQPMSFSPSASGRRFWRCFPGKFLKHLLQSVKLWIVDGMTRVCNWLADALWLLLCR